MDKVRTLVTLDRQDKAWLDAEARALNVSMTELVRRAVQRLRAEQGSAHPSFKRLLKRTSGVW